MATGAPAEDRTGEEIPESVNHESGGAWNPFDFLYLRVERTHHCNAYHSATQPFWCIGLKAYLSYHDSQLAGPVWSQNQVQRSSSLIRIPEYSATVQTQASTFQASADLTHGHAW